jgi:hypothetical protein
VFEGLSGAVSEVKDADGNRYVPSEGINEIGDWDALQGYMVHVTENAELIMEGSAVTATTSIPLEKGWNLVPYYPETALPVTEALSSISDQLVAVKDRYGNAYLPQYSINDIGELQPGRGYRIYVSSATELTYPSESETSTPLTAR